MQFVSEQQISSYNSYPVRHYKQLLFKREAEMQEEIVAEFMHTLFTLYELISNPCRQSVQKPPLELSQSEHTDYRQHFPFITV